MAVNPIPRGYAGATPYLIIRDADRALAFYRRCSAKGRCISISDGKVAHADSDGEGIDVVGEMPEGGYRVAAFGGTPVSRGHVNEATRCSRRRRAVAETKHPVADHSMATAAARSSIRSATSGRSPRT